MVKTGVLHCIHHISPPEGWCMFHMHVLLDSAYMRRMSNEDEDEDM